MRAGDAPRGAHPADLLAALDRVADRDLRRLIKYYGRTADQVFPSGDYLGAAGGKIGNDVNFPVPIDEQNNPDAPKCTDRSP